MVEMGTMTKKFAKQRIREENHNITTVFDAKIKELKNYQKEFEKQLKKEEDPETRIMMNQVSELILSYTVSKVLCVNLAENHFKRMSETKINSQ